jgi:hypothetical protein
LDDLFYLYNNITDTTLENWEGPLLNFSGLIAKNFSQGITNCMTFVNGTYFYAIVRFAYFDNNLSSFLWGFLYGFLGNTLVIKNVFDTILKDIANQNYYDVAT